VLHDDEDRKRSFGLHAELYDGVRHRYPTLLVERVLAYANVTSASRLLEVGSGTGIATLPFAERDCAIECVELSEAMANVARAKLAAFPRVHVHTTSFEAFDAEPASFVVVAAPASAPAVDALPLMPVSTCVALQPAPTESAESPKIDCPMRRMGTLSFFLKQ